METILLHLIEEYIEFFLKHLPQQRRLKTYDPETRDPTTHDPKTRDPKEAESPRGRRPRGKSPGGKSSRGRCRGAFSLATNELPTFGGKTFLPLLLSTGSAAKETLPQQRRLKAYDPEAVRVGAYMVCYDTNMAGLAQKESIPDPKWGLNGEVKR